MASFVDQVKEIGVKQAIIGVVDDSVERLTAGMNVNDIRGMLRGDEPRRPNPRLRPHADSFWLHIRPSFYHQEVTHIYPTFRLGWLSTFLFVWETLTGIFLMIFYTPSPDVAYQDIWNILGNVPLGQFARNLHRWGAEVMVLIVALHMLRTYITGSYKKPRQFTWFTGMILLVLTLILSFSGYLLPWDQLAYWAVTVAVSAAESSPGPPWVGTNINLLLRGAPTIGAGGLLRFYLLHVLFLPLVLGIFFFVHYYKVVLHGISLPPGREAIGEDTAKRVPRDERVYFMPEILTNELMWTALTTLFLVASVIFFYNAPLERQANPLVTPLHVVAPWYLAWSQGWLKLASKEFVSFVFIPGLATVFVVMPYIEPWMGKSRRYRDRRLALVTSAAFISFMWISNWMGSPEYRVDSSADQEVAQEIMPQEGHSEILSVPYSELSAGLVNIGDSAEYKPGEIVAGSPHLTEVLHEFEVAMYNHSCSVNGVDTHLDECVESESDDGTVRYANFFISQSMPDPEARLIIEKVQDNMVRLILEFEAENPRIEGENLFEYTRVGYRHIDSNYEAD